MENRAVEKAVLRILQEVLHRFRRLVLVELDQQGTLRGLDLELGIGGVGGDAEQECENKQEQAMHGASVGTGMGEGWI